MKILVVDDDRDTLAAMADGLEAHGHVVARAPDATHALAMAAIERPDLVVADLVLPDAAGFSLIDQLHELPGCGSMPIVAVSGFPDIAAEARATGQPIFDCLAKPLSVDELASAVERAREQHLADIGHLRHQLANLALGLDGIGEVDLAERCRTLVHELDARIGVTMRSRSS